MFSGIESLNRWGLAAQNGVASCIEVPCDIDSIQHELGIKAIYLHDRQLARRRARLDALFPGLAHHKYDNDNSFLFREVGDRFGVVLFHGDDERRMGHVIRIYTPMLIGKGKFAFVSNSAPTGRAKLLRAGFDDVFDLDMPADEIAARIMSTIRRISIRIRNNKNNYSMINWDIVNLYAKKTLSAREAEIFTILHRKVGEIVEYHSLFRSQITGRRTGRRRALSVTICKMRKKLKPNVSIHALYGDGYKLIIDDRSSYENRPIAA